MEFGAWGVSFWLKGRRGWIGEVGKVEAYCFSESVGICVGALALFRANKVDSSLWSSRLWIGLV